MAVLAFEALRALARSVKLTDDGFRIDAGLELGLFDRHCEERSEFFRLFLFEFLLGLARFLGVDGLFGSLLG